MVLENGEPVVWGEMHRPLILGWKGAIVAAMEYAGVKAVKSIPTLSFGPRFRVGARMGGK